MRILIAGIGNIFHGDDSFGVELAQLLMRRSLPEAVRVVDFGIRGFDLAYALLDGYDSVILLDASSREGLPGTLYTIEIPGALPESSAVEMNAHSLNPAAVIRMARSMGECCPRILLVGCEPETFGPEDEGAMGLSASVAGSLEAAAELVQDLVARLLQEETAVQRHKISNA